MAAGKTVTLQMNIGNGRITKGTYMYAEKAEDGKRQHTFYLDKAHVEAIGNPDAVEITIKAK